MISIAIDGPSGSGKSTLAKELAKRLGFIYVDTGAMYRTLALFTLNSGIDPYDTAKVAENIVNADLKIMYENGEQHMYLCGKDVSGKIRTSEISAAASVTSAIPEVRAFLLDTQRNFARTNNVIMDGRDIGTVILPDATVKFFMTASDDARALRRLQELTDAGENVTLDDVKSSMKTRDTNDSTRKVAPAIPAKDAVMLDNSGAFEDTVRTAMNVIREKAGL